MWWYASIREDVRESRGAESREKDEKRGLSFDFGGVKKSFSFYRLKKFFFF